MKKDFKIYLSTHLIYKIKCGGVFLLILIVLGLVFYFQRIRIKEFFVLEKQINLPREIKFEEIFKETEEQRNKRTEEQINENTKETDSTKEVKEINSSVNSEFSEGINPRILKSVGINLAVPFTIQSPDQKWELPFKEGCEEAVILMVYSFLNDKQITISSALNDIQEMVDWQIENYKAHFDLSATTTVEMAKIVYNLEAEIIELNSIEDIKNIIQTGYPLILPCAGRELGNPNFRTPGPLYHMLVVKGFTNDGLIITNDPGTRKGEDYVYNPDVLWNAIADWDYKTQNPDQNVKIGILLK